MRHVVAAGAIAAVAVGFAMATVVTLAGGHVPAGVVAVAVATTAVVVLFALAAILVIGRVRASAAGPLGPEASVVGERRRVRRWFGAAAALIALAVAIRSAGLVGADLVPYLVAGGVGCAAAGALRPVARWIGFRAVRVTEFRPEERVDVTVEGNAHPAGVDPVRVDPVRVDPVRVDPVGAPRDSGRFTRGTIAATGYLARRRDLDRVVALAIAGIAIAGAATFQWTSGTAARHDRAVIEIGADRVLTVAAVTPARLMADVRAADPSGRYAMAVVVTRANAGSGAVVAVDGERLAAVLPRGVRSGPTGGQLAELLRPNADAALTAITGPETVADQSYDPLSAQAGALTIKRIGSPVPGVPAGGILVDLGDVLPLAPSPTTPVTSQVWLAADAPSSVVADLANRGLRVIARTSSDSRADYYAGKPDVTVARLQLLAGFVVLCCVAFVLGAVIRAHRGTRTIARGVGLVTAVWVGGMVGAMAARHAGPDFVTSFRDGWARVPPPPLVGAAPFAAFAFASALVLATALVSIVARRRPRPGVVNPPGPARPPDRSSVLGSPVLTDGPRTVSR